LYKIFNKFKITALYGTNVKVLFTLDAFFKHTMVLITDLIITEAQNLQ